MSIYLLVVYLVLGFQLSFVAAKGFIEDCFLGWVLILYDSVVVLWFHIRAIEEVLHSMAAGSTMHLG